MNNHYTYETQLLLNDNDEFYSNVEIEIEYEVSKEEPYFDRMFGNWLPGSNIIDLIGYQIYEPNGNMLDAKKILTLNPELPYNILTALEKLTD